MWKANVSVVAKVLERSSRRRQGVVKARIGSRLASVLSSHASRPDTLLVLVLTTPGAIAALLETFFSLVLLLMGSVPPTTLSTADDGRGLIGAWQYATHFSVNIGVFDRPGGREQGLHFALASEFWTNLSSNDTNAVSRLIKTAVHAHMKRHRQTLNKTKAKRKPNVPLISNNQLDTS
ncbi:hypothetical protein ABVK25_006773 [Lepraria finkii]|uniref:Uncharacterized protein n=1 Tax=Lepraria finkii TaxID=1340010 RepID=A0ABR4B7K0_9LECA